MTMDNIKHLEEVRELTWHWANDRAAITVAPNDWEPARDGWAVVVVWGKQDMTVYLPSLDAALELGEELAEIYNKEDSHD